MSMISNEYEIFIDRFKAITKKQLKKLNIDRNIDESNGFKSYTNKITKDTIYYKEQKPSAKSVFIMDFYIELIKNNCYVRKLSLNYNMHNITADAFIEFQRNNDLYFTLINVETTFPHNSKFQVYEKAYKVGAIQKDCYDIFPSIVVICNNSLKYISNNFEVIYLNTELTQFKEKIF